MRWFALGGIAGPALFASVVVICAAMRPSVAGFVSAIAGIALSAYRFRSVTVWRPLWLYSALSSAVALCFLVALAHSIDARSLIGLWQRLLVGTLFLWCAVAGVQVFRLGRRRAV
jgi:hypothetical protein